MKDSASDSGAIPDEILRIAKATRAVFGGSVRLKFAAWPGGQAGSPAFDDPAGMDARQLHYQLPPT